MNKSIISSSFPYLAVCSRGPLCFCCCNLFSYNLRLAALLESLMIGHGALLSSSSAFTTLLLYMSCTLVMVTVQ